MLYFALVYFSWCLALGLWIVLAVYGGRRGGLIWLSLGGLVQVSAFALHLSEWRRLAGEPDRIYVWIGPLVIAAFGVLLWMVGLVVQWRSWVGG